MQRHRAKLVGERLEVQGVRPGGLDADRTPPRYTSLVVRRRDATMPAMLRKNAAAMSGRSRCTLAKLCRESTWNSLASVVRAVALRRAPSMKLISPITSPGPNDASERST